MNNNSKDDSKIGRNQLVSNAALYYVCYELSKRGWNVMPTSRNARGIDIVIYNQKGTELHTIQVKGLSDKTPAPLGNTLNNLIADYIFIVNNISETPNVFIMDTLTAKGTPTNKGLIHEGLKDGRKSYWIQPNQYEKFKDNWSVMGRV